MLRAQIRSSDTSRVEPGIGVGMGEATIVGVGVALGAVGAGIGVEVGTASAAATTADSSEMFPLLATLSMTLTCVVVTQ